MKAQAVVIDGLFLLILCALCSAFLLWAVSAYGQTSFKAYRSLYMGEYNTGILDTLTEYEYLDDDNVHRFLLDEIGAYLEGKFDETSPRYGNMTKQWHTVCAQAPHPLEVNIYSSKGDSLVLNCPLSNKNPQGYDTSDMLYDFVRERCPSDGAGGQIPCGENINFKPPHETVQVLYGCPDANSDGEPDPCIIPPPYYSSGEQTKICSTIACVMEAKVYY